MAEVVGAPVVVALVVVEAIVVGVEVVVVVVVVVVVKPTPFDNPLTSVGTSLSLVELFPSWPPKFAPQHFTPPLPSRAQVW